MCKKVKKCARSVSFGKRSMMENALFFSFLGRGNAIGFLIGFAEIQGVVEAHRVRYLANGMKIPTVKNGFCMGQAPCNDIVLRGDAKAGMKDRSEIGSRNPAQTVKSFRF